jgi:hypothetical protein
VEISAGAGWVDQIWERVEAASDSFHMVHEITERYHVSQLTSDVKRTTFRVPSIGPLKKKSSTCVDHDAAPREGEAPAEPPGPKMNGSTNDTEPAALGGRTRLMIFCILEIARPSFLLFDMREKPDGIPVRGGQIT